MRVAIPLLVALPLLAAGVSMGLHRWRALQQVLGVATLVVALATAVGVLVEVERNGPVAAHIGAWPAGIGVALVVDLFAALMLVISLVTVLVVLVYAIGQHADDDDRPFFHPLYLVLTAGVVLSFVTADLFNLFVAFEVMLSASYVLITLGGRREQVRSGMTYVVINLLSSTLLITAVALVYAATGTVDMAELSVRLTEIPSGVRDALGLLFIVVFGVKAAIFPLFFWLPDSYPTAPAPVTAVFAGLLTKVGVYVIVRTQTLLFGDAASDLLLVVAAATMLVGVLGAIAQDDVKRILSFHIVSQIGYMIFGLGLFTVAGLAATVFYVVHHIAVKTSLFLVGGMVETATGTGALSRVGGLLRRAPVMAALFAPVALSLAGLPPFSGFVGKLALVQAGLGADAYIVTGVSLVVSLLTLFSMTKIWAGVFWGVPEQEPPLESARGEGPLRSPRLMTGATTALVGVTLAVAVFGGPLYDLADRAATDLLEPAAYLQAVRGR